MFLKRSKNNLYIPTANCKNKIKKEKKSVTMTVKKNEQLLIVTNIKNK